MTQDDGEQVLGPYASHLRESLKQTTDDGSLPSESSDGWVLLNALITHVAPDDLALKEHFLQVGQALAAHAEQLDQRLHVLQQTMDVLLADLRGLFIDRPALLLDVIQHLFRLHSVCVLAVSQGYQQVSDELASGHVNNAQQLDRRLQALQRINGMSNSAMDLDQTLEVTAQIVADELNAQLCSIFFYDDLQRVLTLRATNGPRPLGGMHFTLRLGEGYSGWVADKGRPLLIQDALSDSSLSSETQAYTAEYHGLMSLPIIFFGNAERLIGVINVQSHKPRDFSQDEVSFVEVVAGIVAINIENGRLYEQTDEQLRRKVYELGTIHRVSANIASTLNLDEVLQFITTQAVHLSGAERSCIFELDPDRRRLHVSAHYGFDNELVRRTYIAVGQCCAGRTVQTGRPSMAVDCFHTDEHCFIHNDPLISSEIHSVLCVPLKVKQNILGCICIYSNHRHLLSPEQLQMVVTFANEAAIAIDNARLYEETRRGLELKSVLLRELHHRVKNNLATVAGILSLQRRRTKSSEVRHILAESVNRVQGLAATHDLLAHEDVSEARLDEISRKIIGVANTNMSPPDKRISFLVEADSVIIPSRAVTILALVINEMVSNAIKHGMAGQSEGTITLRGREVDGSVVVQVIDNGNEPISEPPQQEESGEGLGLSLIKHLIGDLGGRFTLRRELAGESAGTNRELASGDGKGQEQTVAEIRFPLVRRSRT
ncbi:MAG TPA: GAF domain-containing protein [Ktedonobacteraceae bacterium]|nr:GAF domain-containing protein [Ktedonobacteraceae bacterium]